VKSAAKMYGLRDRAQDSTVGHESTRSAEVDSVVSMIRKIEREIAQYVVAHADEFGLEAEAPVVAKAA